MEKQAQPAVRWVPVPDHSSTIFVNVVYISRAAGRPHQPVRDVLAGTHKGIRGTHRRSGSRALFVSGRSSSARFRKRFACLFNG